MSSTQGADSDNQRDPSKEEKILAGLLIAVDMMRQGDIEDVRILLQDALKKLKEASD